MPPTPPPDRRIELIGRRAERARLRRALGATGHGRRIIVIRGEPGLGKSSLWLYAMDTATRSGFVVTSARPAPSEARLSYGVLIDLLDGLLDDDGADLAALPSLQREALTAIREGSRDGVARAWQVVGTAFLAVLRRSVADDRRVVIGIDDIQWADRSSIRVLEYALRRAADLPIRLLATERVSMERTARETPEPLADLEPEVWPLDPMTSADLVTVLRHRLRRLPADAAAEVARQSGANPFIALEMGRLRLESGVLQRPVGPAPISRRLKRLAAVRVGALDDRGLEVALLASVLTRPTTAILQAAAGDTDRVGRGLADAEEAGVLELRGEVWAFTHPLLGAAVYDGASAADRRALHALVARVAADPEERAWHLALAATGADLATAQALADAATVASARGAPDSALALWSEAIRLTPSSSTDLASRRRVEVARCLQMLDRLRDALAMARTATGFEVEPATRSLALELCGHLVEDLVGVAEAVDCFAQALELTEDVPTAVRVAERYIDLLPYVDRADEVDALLVENVLRARSTGDPALITRTEASRITHEFQRGRRRGDEALASLLRLPDGGNRAHGMIAQVALWSDRPDVADDQWQIMLDHADQTGDDNTRASESAYRADMDIRIGRLERAGAVLQERLPIELEGDQLRAAHLLFISARLHAIRGDERQARDAARRAIDLGGSISWYVARSLAVLGLLELSKGASTAAADRYDEAAEAGGPWLLDRRHGVYFISIDRVEAQAGAGRLADARAGLERLEAKADAWGDGWLLAAVARCRAVVHGVEGDLAAALEAAYEAVTRYEALPYPLDLGRARLVAGTLHRRLTHRRDARRSLEQAGQMFRELGAAIWLERATVELARIGGRAPSVDALTPSESAVAGLVAQGLTNAEVAARLFLTTRTVESHLTQVYAKLGVRSRTELASRRNALEPTA